MIGAHAAAAATAQIDYNKLDLDGDWDPDAFDKAMGNIFNDEYYEEEDEDLPVKPATEGEGSGSEDEGALEAFMTGEKRPAWAGAVDASDVPDTSAASEKAKKLKEMLTKKAEKEVRLLGRARYCEQRPHLALIGAVCAVPAFFRGPLVCSFPFSLLPLDC